MGLKNKDGTPYKLAGPNPIMSEMAMWEKEGKLIIHNLRGERKLYSYEDSKVVFRNNQPEIVQKIEAPTEPVKEVAPDPFDAEEQPEAPEVPEEIPIISGIEGEKLAAELGVDKIQVWCRPAFFRQYKDDLYGDTESKVRYGEKFLFEAVLEDMTDLELVLYTTTDEVTEGSVLFPRTHDKRWWRVVETRKSEDGLIRIYASFTDHHPDFSSLTQ